tara:strand:- start:127 stop:357 length:231 start_codon:yes stop_codon:yes gene_type:complete
MGITSAIAFFLKLMDGLLGYFREKKMMDGAVAQAKVESLEGVVHDIQLAQATRDAVRNRAAADPSSLRAPDPNSRD